MKKIIEYRTIKVNFIDHLDAKVKDFMEDGWQPFGNAYFVKDGVFRIRICQAMVKYEK